MKRSFIFSFFVLGLLSSGSLAIAMQYQTMKVFYGRSEGSGLNWLYVVSDQRTGIPNLAVFPMSEPVADFFSQLDTSRDFSNPLTCSGKVLEVLTGGNRLVQVFDVKDCK